MGEYNLDNQARKIWYKIYKNREKICLGCRNKIMIQRNKEMTIFDPLNYMGPYYKFSRYKLMIIGKASWDNDIAENTRDMRTDIFSNEIITKRIQTNKGFWKWIIKIPYELECNSKWVNNKDDDIQKYRAFQCICYSNLVKCDINKTSSKFSDDEDIVNNCLCNAGWIFDEIRALRPTPKNIIIFAGTYRYNLPKTLLKDTDFQVINDPKLKIKDFGGGVKYPLFRHLDWNGTRVIVTIHPERKNETVFNRIIEIIKNDEPAPDKWDLPKGKKEMQKVL